jgi:hypothetical protein
MFYIICFFITDAPAKQAWALVPVEHFYPSLIFLGKTNLGACPCKAFLTKSIVFSQGKQA